MINVVIDAGYALTFKPTRRGQPSTLPVGATVVWTVDNPELGSVEPNPSDVTKATFTAGPAIGPTGAGPTGRVTAHVEFDGASGPVAFDALSPVLQLTAGEPDGGGVELGPEQ